MINHDLMRRMAACRVDNFYGRLIRDAEKEILALQERLMQPAREWQSLTDNEIEALAGWWPSYNQMPALKALIKDVSNSLKEKNA